MGGFTVKKKFTRMKVEKKVSVVITILSIVLLTGVVLSLSVQSIMTSDKLLKDYFGTLAETNASLVSYKFELAENILNQIEATVSTATIAEGPDVESKVYEGIELDATGALAEERLVGHMWKGLETLPLLSSIGVYYDPKYFGLDEYAFVVNRKNMATQDLITYDNYSDYSNEEFFATVMQTKKDHLSLPLVNAYGENIITLSKPLVQRNTVVGVLTADILTDEFKDIGIVHDDYGTLFSSIWDEELHIIYEMFDASKIGTEAELLMQEKSSDKILTLMETGEPFGLRTYAEPGDAGDGYMHERFFAPIKVADQLWWAHVGARTATIHKDIVRIMWTALLVAIFSVIMIAVVIMFVSRELLRPLEGLKNIAESVECGNLSTKVEPTYDDDIGKLTNTFNNMGTTLSTIIKEIEMVLEQMSNGDFIISNKIRANYTGDFVTIKRAFIKISEKLQSTLKTISSASTEVSTGADNIASSAMNLAEVSQHQTEAVNEFIEITEDMAIAVEKINTKIVKNATYGKNAITSAEEGKVAMKEMLDAMNKIADSSKTISNVLDALQAITKQTNLLALNAAIEATHAGEAGKGFSVVAGEIRNLANNSSDAVKEVEMIVKENVVLAKGGQQIANKTAGYLDKVADTIGETGIISDELLKMSNVQKENIEGLVTNIKMLRKSILENAASSQENTAVGEELAAQAMHLEELMKEFKF